MTAISQTKGIKALLGLTLGLCLSLVSTASAKAGNGTPHNMDYFGRMTERPQAVSKVKAPAASTMPTFKTVRARTTLEWFEQLDEAVAVYRPTSAERVILTRPFNQESDRVQQWTNTAAHVAKKYRHLARLIGTMTPPSNVHGLAEYRNLTADWYNDSASLYEEMIRPRVPASTIEELQVQVSAVKDRAKSLSKNFSNLKTMDSQLREAHQIHPARYDDALQKYVRSKPTS